MQPLFFGASGHQLFGTYHPPEGSRVRTSSILICHPAPQEYMRTFWALKRLAAHLAKDDFHVLRFDYSGTGDSGGLLPESDLETWRNDLTTAAAELKDLSGGLPISVVGMRLGASLAFTTPGLALRDLILWDPVVRGGPYLRRLNDFHSRRYGARLRRPSRPSELLGLEISRAMERGIADIDLLRDQAPAARRIGIVDSAGLEETRLLEAHLRDLGASVTRDIVPEPTSARAERDLNISLMAPVSMQRISDRLTGSAP